jgi:hypothetical protein
MGTVTTFIIALVTAVAAVTLVFHPYSGSYNPYFEYRDLMSVSLLFIIMVGAPSISFIMALRIYISKDI